MQSTNIPSKIPLPFANSAGSSYKNTIPVASQIGITNGKASLTDGFPPLTFQAISAGGVPPFGADFNGILNEITAIQQWQEAGGFFPYDSAFSTTVGGYPKGAVLQSTTFNGFWTSTVENNTSNPDTGGAGWVPTNFSGVSPISISSATTTLTTLQAAYPIIVFSGTLTANSTVIVPNFANEWIFVNNTSGAYTLQVKTSAGTGISLVQGYSTFAYGDATNIYFANSASVSSFNGRTGAISLNATDVTNALGYIPVDPASFVSSFITNGYQKLPNGLIIQWGTYFTNSSGGGLFNYPISFPNACFQTSVTPILYQDTAGDWGNGGAWVGSYNNGLSTFTVASYAANHNVAPNLEFNLIAIGY